MIDRRIVRTSCVALPSLCLLAGANASTVNAIASQRFEVACGDHATLAVPFEASHPLHEKHESITRLVVMVHGILRNTSAYHPMVMRAHQMAGSPEHVAVISPQFLTAADLDAYGLGAEMAYWPSNEWPVGQLSSNDSTHPRAAQISSFAVLDAMLLKAAASYPNLQTLVVAGHSAGGQFVNRYAAGNRVHDDLQQRGIDVSYIVTNPSSYLYFCDNRPVCIESSEFAPIVMTSYADCDGIAQYRFGLEGLNDYMIEAGAESLADRYASRQVTIFLGSEDNDANGAYLARSCAAMAQGRHRLERGIGYYAYLKFRFGEEVYQRHSIEIVPGVGHNSMGMFTSEIGLRLLFGGDHDEAPVVRHVSNVEQNESR